MSECRYGSVQCNEQGRCYLCDEKTDPPAPPPVIRREDRKSADDTLVRALLGLSPRK